MESLWLDAVYGDGDPVASTGGTSLQSLWGGVRNFFGAGQEVEMEEVRNSFAAASEAREPLLNINEIPAAIEDLGGGIPGEDLRLLGGPAVVEDEIDEEFLMYEWGEQLDNYDDLRDTDFVGDAFDEPLAFDSPEYIENLAEREALLEEDFLPVV